MGDISHSSHYIVLNEISQSQREKYFVIPRTRLPTGFKLIERRQVKMGGLPGSGEEGEISYNLSLN